MKPFEENYTAWIDGELAGQELAEFEAELAKRGGSPQERSAILRLGEFLRGQEPGPELKNADFFNHQLLERIRKEERPAAAPYREPSFLFPLGRLLWAGASCILAAALIFHFAIPAGPQVNPTPSSYMARVLDAHSDDPDISASAFHSKKDDVTVVWLDGLDYIPADYAEK